MGLCRPNSSTDLFHIFRECLSFSRLVIIRPWTTFPYNCCHGNHLSIFKQYYSVGLCRPNSSTDLFHIFRECLSFSRLVIIRPWTTFPYNCCHGNHLSIFKQYYSVGLCRPNSSTDLFHIFRACLSFSRLVIIRSWTTFPYNCCHGNHLSIFKEYYSVGLCRQNSSTDLFHIFRACLSFSRLVIIRPWTTFPYNCCHGNHLSIFKEYYSVGFCRPNSSTDLFHIFRACLSFSRLVIIRPWTTFPYNCCHGNHLSILSSIILWVSADQTALQICFTFLENVYPSVDL